MEPQVIDHTKRESFVMRAIGDLSAGYGGVLVSIGSKLGLYKAMAGAGPMDPQELAARTGCSERYVSEWLNAQAAGGYVIYHPADRTYELTAEQAMVLADEDSPVYIPNAWNIPASMWLDEEKAIKAFRTGTGVKWGDHAERLHRGVAGFYRNAYRGSLLSQWLPALEGVVAHLEAGITVADIGCGHGHSTILMAQAFANSRFHGFDTHAASIDEARHAAEALAPGGTVMLVEPFANDRLEDNLSPVARLYYAGSTMLCCAHAISEGGQLVLGAQAGEARLAEVFRSAGFTHFRRAAETRFNLILEARR